MNKSFNATANGQKAMCYDASDRATAFTLAKWLRSRGMPAWDDAFISSCNKTILESIKADMLADYNAATSKIS